MIKFKKYVSNNKYLKNALILITFFVFFLLIDLLTKFFIFDKTVVSGRHTKNLHANWKVIGWRSQAHKGSMFLDLLNITLPYWATLSIGYFLAIFFIFFGIFSNTKLKILFIALSLAGIIGNTIDNTYLNYVRNIMFLPWMDKGTFNFADIWIIIGSLLLGVLIIFESFQNKNKHKKTK